MKVERTPFTIFDFIGYFIPGFIFIYVLYLTFNVEFDSILSLEAKHCSTSSAKICGKSTDNNSPHANKEKTNEQKEHKNTGKDNGLSGKTQDISQKSSCTYEYIIFTVFMLVFSWFIGHLLSWASHLFQEIAKKIFDNNSKESVTPLLDPFGQGKMNIFQESNFEKIVNNLFERLLKRETECKSKCNSSKEETPKCNKCETFELKELLAKDDSVNKRSFLKSISNYLDPEKYQTVYNYLVIQGAFRAFTLLFLLHIIILLLGSCECLGIGPCLEDVVITYCKHILIADFVMMFTCWNIYLKYHRRHIEETTVLLIYELYLKKPDDSKSKWFFNK